MSFDNKYKELIKNYIKFENNVHEILINIETEQLKQKSSLKSNYGSAKTGQNKIFNTQKNAIKNEKNKKLLDFDTFKWKEQNKVRDILLSIDTPIKDLIAILKKKKLDLDENVEKIKNVQFFSNIDESFDLDKISKLSLDKKYSTLSKSIQNFAYHLQIFFQEKDKFILIKSRNKHIRNLIIFISLILIIFFGLKIGNEYSIHRISTKLENELNKKNLNSLIIERNIKAILFQQKFRSSLSIFNNKSNQFISVYFKNCYYSFPLNYIFTFMNWKSSDFEIDMLIIRAYYLEGMEAYNNRIYTDSIDLFKKIIKFEDSTFSRYLIAANNTTKNQFIEYYTKQKAKYRVQNNLHISFTNIKLILQDTVFIASKDYLEKGDYSLGFEYARQLHQDSSKYKKLNEFIQQNYKKEYSQFVSDELFNDNSLLSIKKRKYTKNESENRDIVDNEKKQQIKYDMERYKNRIFKIIKNQYNCGYLSRNKTATIVITIMKNGVIKSDMWFEKRSGNMRFDECVIDTIKKSNPLPPLPELYMRSWYGPIALNF